MACLDRADGLGRWELRGVLGSVASPSSSGLTIAGQPSAQTLYRGPATKSRSFRRDIEGLRAVAVGLVLLWHAGVPTISAGYVGVDVFFVVSGYLINGLILREVESSGEFSLSRFYARRIRRLLPAASAVIVAVTFGTVVWLPRPRWWSIAGDILASTFYVQNWRQAAQAVDYFAEDVAASPLQHYWTLAVEEQFYFVWPLIIAVTLVVADRRRLRRRLLPPLVLITVASFVHALDVTAARPEQAYFITTSRVWQFAAGALLATASPRRLWERLRAWDAAGWVGLVLVVGSAFAIPVDAAYPGMYAVMPTVGTLLVLVSGEDVGSRGPVRVLRLWPLQWGGRYSYSLYLWHWPALVLATAYFGDLDALQGLAVVVVSAVPAVISYRFVEAPVRHSDWLGRSPARALVVLAVTSAAGLLGAVVLATAVPSHADVGADSQLYQQLELQEQGLGAGDGALGAAVLGSDPFADPDGAPRDEVDPVIPDPVVARSDRAADMCLADQEDTEVVRCSFGADDGDHVVLVGDSHAMQWLTPLRTIGEDRGWRLEAMAKSSCPAHGMATYRKGRPDDACRQWNENLGEVLAAEAPRMAIFSGTDVRSYAGGEPGPPVANAAGYVERWEELIAGGTHVVVIADNPYIRIDLPDCVAMHPRRLTRCTTPRDSAWSNNQTIAAAVAQVPEVTYIDLRAFVCPHDPCAPVIGNVLVWRDTSHLTDTYVRTLTPRLAAEIPRLDAS